MPQHGCFWSEQSAHKRKQFVKSPAGSAGLFRFARRRFCRTDHSILCMGTGNGFCLGQAGAAVLTYLDIVGLEEFLRKLRPCGAKRSAKYRQLLASLGSKCYYEDISRRIDEQDWLCRVKSLIQGGGPGGIHPTQQNKNFVELGGGKKLISPGVPGPELFPILPVPRQFYD